MKRQFPITSRQHSLQAGFTIIELSVTMILLGMLMALVVPLLGTINKQQREADRRIVAVQLIDNLMERFTSNDFDGITQSAADHLELSPEDASFLPDAKLEITVSEGGGDFTGKQITITLTWNSSDGVAVTPARLTTFVYPDGRES